MNNEEKDLVCIFCPPLSQYPEQPPDMSTCILEDCPKCNQKMWLSEKKKMLIDEIVDKEIVLLCYECFIKFAKKNKDILNNHIKVDL